MAKSYQTTDARGAALAEEILDIIEVEEKLRRKRVARTGNDSLISGEDSTWYQGSWAMVDLDQLPPNTHLEPLTAEVKHDVSYWRDQSDRLATIDSGVSCGTAMCFAGHAATLAGDKLVVALRTSAARQLREGKPRKNVRRWLSKVRKTQYGQHDYFSGEDIANAIDLVLTPEGKVVSIADRARQLLGLTPAEADLLFDGGNNLETIRGYVKQLSEGRYLTTGRKRPSKK